MMSNKPGKKDSRNSKTPPEKKRIKTLEVPTCPVQEEPEPVSCVLQGDEIQALAIKLEDLAKLRTAHLPQEEKEKSHVTKKFLVRKSRPQEIKKKAQFLVAYPTLADESKKTLHYSGIEGPVIDSYGHILPHTILGTLQEFKEEALRRGHSQVASLVPDDSQLTCGVSVLGKYREKHEEEKKTEQRPSSQNMALQNWYRNMALRRKQQKKLSEYLQKSESNLVMNFSENYRKVQEQRTLIDRSIPALFSGKGYSGQEFWTEPVCFGDEVSGLAVTLGQTERGFPEEVTHVGKPHRIWMEMGTRPPKYQVFHYTWEKSLFLKHRRNELKEVLEKLDFYNPDIDGLEVIGRNRPFTSVSAKSFSISEDKEFLDEKKIPDLLEEYPDIFSEPVLGPSLKFCGQPARWINTTVPKGEVGIAARVTFEILVGEKAESLLTVTNDGTAAIWYDWRRLPPPFSFQEKKRERVQNFYFNTRSGVILPGETKRFSFIFKSMNTGIFHESWEFSTRPTLLGGAVLQVTLWGVALYEDISFGIREELQKTLEEREAAVIVEENLKDLLDQIRTPERARSPLDAYVTEEELFLRKNPELYYEHQVVRELHDLWDKLMNPPQVVEVYMYSDSPPKSAVEAQKSPEDTSHRKSVSPDISKARKSMVEEVTPRLPERLVQEMKPVDPVDRVEWNLSVADFKQSVLAIPEEDEREAALTQLNKAALELCIAPLTTWTELLYCICFQLWCEVIDGLVTHSLMLRSLLGMPEKDTYLEVVPTESVEMTPVPVKTGREDQRVQKEDRKVAGKEKEKGRASKEERSNSRKMKQKEEKKSKSSVKEAKETVSISVDAAEAEQPDRREQVDPVVQEKYHEKLYGECPELDSVFQVRSDQSRIELHHYYFCLPGKNSLLRRNVCAIPLDYSHHHL
ncbi:MYCBP-associated protein isoform X2 [Anolis carolinensis]|uniref:MYCBP-associated protein isoform X2 n=1 Tax=Anolis carolinensis TaxID=28377 RepID=UPI002F2B8616